MNTCAMNKVVLFFIFFVSASFVSKASDTLHVVTHNKMTVVTDPSRGFNIYKAWGVFPSKKVPVRKILLKLQLGCPDSIRCADWDYKDHITIRRIGGVNGASQDYEIGRMLTPYGGAFQRGWKFNWEVDITDFSMLLRDSVEIEYNHTGYEPNQDRGWSVTLDFEIIKGLPALEPVSIQKIYDGSFRYGDSISIENQLKPQQFTAARGASMGRLRVVQTGHGMDRPDNCAEFCNKFRELWFDGKLIDVKNIWKTCGDNPLYPQAGTWLYDRANWCPGTLMQPDVYDLPIKPGALHTVDINMQAYRSSNPSADQVISAYLVQYKKPLTRNDVSIEDIIVPSSKDAYKRINPSGNNARILVRNLGSNTVRSLKIEYFTAGFKPRVIEWKGQLDPFKTKQIELPGRIDSHNDGNIFDVKLTRINGKKDSYGADNELRVPFHDVPKVDSILVISLQTNNESSDNGYVVIDEKGAKVYEKAVGSFKKNTLYRDTIRLGQGVYKFLLTDTAANGLEFWANPKGGYGKARILNSNEEMIYDIESDFGSFVNYSFEVSGQPDAPPKLNSIGLYPTRTMGTTTLDYFSNEPAEVEVKIITDPGDKVVEHHTYNQLRSGQFTYDLSRFPKGRFYLKVFLDSKEVYKKRIRLKE